jgi:hypothetical protein
MDLAKHIIYLLQFHECLIVPGFGGFISNYKPARYNAMNHTFNPPSKEVVFNSKITNNDGLLINHLVDAERIGYRQAHKAVLNFTESLFERLNNGETVSFENLGSFSFDVSGMIGFTPATSFELIEAYGLKPFTYQSLNGSKPVEDFKPRQAVRALEHDRNWIKVAAAAAVLLTLSLYPIKNNNNLHLQSSNLLPKHVLTAEPIPVKAQNETLAEWINEEVAEPEVVAKVEKGTYILVGGSFEFLENAQTLIEVLITKGHKAEIILMENGQYRVAIDSFFERSEALEAMKSYRAAHPGSMAWVSTR